MLALFTLVQAYTLRVAHPAPSVQRAASCKMMVGYKEATALAPSACHALQSGTDADAGDALSSCLSSAPAARGFFELYLTGLEYECADAHAPPPVLMDYLLKAPLAVVDVLLMNVVTSAAATISDERDGRTEVAENSERAGFRARILINALWPSATELQESCDALKDAIRRETEGFLPSAQDQNYELLRDQWSGILGFCDYDADQYIRIQKALKLCGSVEGKVVPREEA